MKYGAIKMIDKALLDAPSQPSILALMNEIEKNASNMGSAPSLDDLAQLAALAVKAMYVAMDMDIGEYPGNVL